MLVLGVIYTLGSLLATALANVLVGGAAPAPAADAQNAPVDARALVAMLLHTPLVVLFWHSPALVHWHGVAPVKSLFFSAVACFRNLGAMLLYGATWLAVFAVVGFVFSTVGMMLGGVAVARSVMMPTVLLLVAMFSTSRYFTFRDSFQADDVPEAQATPGGESAP